MVLCLEILTYFEETYDEYKYVSAVHTIPLYWLGKKIVIRPCAT